jgi:hypothetical protein
MEAEITEYRAALELRDQALKRMCEAQQHFRASAIKWNAADDLFGRAKARLLDFIASEQAVGE